MAILLGIDTGGTYTDAALFESDTNTILSSAKALTTKHDLAVGIRHSLESVLPDPPPEVRLASLSTTLATNAIVEGQGSPICLLLLGYPTDALDRSRLREALGDDPVVFIGGGHTVSGEEQAPLDLDAARRAIEAHAPRATAFAVSGYFAVRNPTHELAIRRLVREMTDLPVTCGHELTSNLDAPRRALTAALNARLIPLLQGLILAVRDMLTERGIHAPVMVVKGDGSLIRAEVALERPVETILSGPAASVVGARHLSGEDDVFVVDMGGTTTDIALLRDGRPMLDADGATVGGWRTMVEAVAVHTLGLGGDSEVRLDKENGLVVGPQRVVPLSLLIHLHPEMLGILRGQSAGDSTGPYDGRFALRQRSLGSRQHRKRYGTDWRRGRCPWLACLATSGRRISSAGPWRAWSSAAWLCWADSPPPTRPTCWDTITTGRWKPRSWEPSCGRDALLNHHGNPTETGMIFAITCCGRSRSSRAGRWWGPPSPRLTI
jgi:N-methylhydantoinase A/oxoprolinase/acetone carboxylase beta subunit